MRSLNRCIVFSHRTSTTRRGRSCLKTTQISATKPHWNNFHDYLFTPFQQLYRVIRARKLHRSHSFAIENHYGHRKYLDKLSNEKQNMTKLLEKLGRRAAAVKYEQKRWLQWVKEGSSQRRGAGRDRIQESQTGVVALPASSERDQAPTDRKAGPGGEEAAGTIPRRNVQTAFVRYVRRRAGLLGSHQGCLRLRT